MKFIEKFPGPTGKAQSFTSNVCNKSTQKSRYYRSRWGKLKFWLIWYDFYEISNQIEALVKEASLNFENFDEITRLIHYSVSVEFSSAPIVENTRSW